MYTNVVADPSNFDVRTYYLKKDYRFIRAMQFLIFVFIHSVFDDFYITRLDRVGSKYVIIVEPINLLT